MTRREANITSWKRVRAFAARILPTGARLLHEWTLLVLLVLAFGGVAVLLWQMSVTSSAFVKAAALQDAARTSDALASFRTLYTSEVVDRVRSRGIEVAHDYESREGSIPLPATLSMKLGDMIGRKHAGFTVRLYSDHPFPWRKNGGPRDAFEAEALVELRRNPDQPFVRFEAYEGRQSLRYASADRMRASCVSCHNSHPDSTKTDWRVGDVRGVLEVVRPLDSFVAQTNAQFRGGFVFIMSFAALGFAAVAFFIVRVRRTLEATKRGDPGSIAQADDEGDAALGAPVSLWKLLLLGVVLAGLILALDLSIPLGVAAAVPYILLVLLSLRSNRESHVVVAAAASTALTILGFVLSPTGGELWKVLTNRFLAIFVVWVTAILCLWQKRKASEQARLVAQKIATDKDSDLVKDILGKLEESEARTRAIVNTASDGIITIGDRGIIESFNHAAARIFGYSASEVVGKNVSLLMPAPFREEHDSYIQRYLDTGVRRILAEGREVIGKRKDGTTFPMDLSVNATTVGERRTFTGITRDITERKMAESGLKRFRLALDASADAIFLIDGETMQFVDASKSACSSVGYSHNELLTIGLHDIEPEFSKEQLAAKFDELIAETVTVGVIETFHRRKDGEGFPVEVMIRSTSVDGRPIVVATVRDITERKWAEEELEKLHKEVVDASRKAGMAEVATGVLHNVGNVLNSVNVSATVVSDKLRGSKVPSLVKAVGLMSEHAHDLGTFITEDEKGRKLPVYLDKLAGHMTAEQSSIICELGALTKSIEHIKKIVSAQQSHAGAYGVVERASIAEVVNDALTVNDTLFERDGIETVREYADLPPTLLDRQKLLQIMVNLVSNAKHAMLRNDSGGKRLTLRITKCETSRTRIEVTDTGVGIPKENLTRIFSHGFTTKDDGHGFGLHSAALAAKEMGGSLGVRSDGPGRGATFTLELPLESAEVTV